LTVACGVFAFLAAIAYAPNILIVVGIHNDYELLRLKSLTILHPEAEQLIRIGRPVAALLSNVPVWPLQTLEDYRWSRIFSVATLCGLAAMMMFSCTRRLGVRVVPAFCVAVGTFMVPPFIYSVLNTAAWAPHLVSILAALMAYSMLSKANVQLLAFADPPRWHGARAALWQMVGYLRLKPVYLACLTYQIAFYDYPPNALVLILFPVITVLFSALPRAYRWLLAIRDTGFTVLSVVIYSLTTKLLYMPGVGLFMRPQVPPDPEINPFEARIAPSYRFNFNTDPIEFFHRLRDTLKVACDLWFLPQFQFHFVVLGAVVLAVVAANVVHRRSSGLGSQFWFAEGLARFSFWGRSSDGMAALAVLSISFLVAASPVVASGGGFVTYRTIAIPTGIAGIVFLFVGAELAHFCWNLGGGWRSSARARDLALILIALAAVASNLFANYETMILARNEFAYFTNIMRAAIKNKSRLVVLYDSRPLSLPEDHPVVYDQRYRSIPPYELACFSGYCLQSGAIAHIAAEELGVPRDYFTVFPMRPGDPFPTMDCPGLMASFVKPPEDLPYRLASMIDWLKKIQPVTCVNYGLEWHDLGERYGTAPNK
jgi:hypothetical protein